MKDRAGRVYLSPPCVLEEDISSVEAAMRSGWVAPVGPDLLSFEAEMAKFVGVSHAVALSSGTAALHLALKSQGVGPGDVVLVPTATFVATAFAVSYVGAEPVFIDIDESWNMDPELTHAAVRDLRAAGKRVAAAVPVDLYGTPANYTVLVDLLTDLDVPLIEDAAEGLGARWEEGRVGALGEVAALSFNGNKIITTSGGGMLLTNDEEIARRVRHWSTQAREPFPWYEHLEVGYNYRMSNILAALGRSQLSRIEEIVAARRAIRERYRTALSGLPGVLVQEDPEWGQSNAWLTVVRFASHLYPDAPTRVREYLELWNIESRPVWKPMHRQPVFSESVAFLSGSADMLFREGLCLPSGTQLAMHEVDTIARRVIEALKTV